MPVDSARHRLTVPTGADPLSRASSSGHKTATTSAASSSSSGITRPTQYLSRLLDVKQMDLQSALDQMKTLLTKRPNAVYKTSYYRKQTKNHWARDDPAFCALQALFLVISCIAYSISFRAPLIDAFAFMVYSLVFHWLGAGFLVATIGREIANRHLTVHQSSTHVRQSVEWLYAFDIHCNAFFPVFVLLCKLKLGIMVHFFLKRKKNVLTHFGFQFGVILLQTAFNFSYFLSFLEHHWWHSLSAIHSMRPPYPGIGTLHI